MAQIIVNSTADGTLAALAGDGKISLREAIEAANTNASVDGSVAGTSGLDTIVFDPAVFSSTRTITLTNSEISINEALAITGTGQTNLAIDGGRTSRIFNSGANVSLTLDSLTLQNARKTGTAAADRGGAIRVGDGGQLSLSQVTLSGNSVSDRGGGFYTGRYSTVTVTNSTISGNSADSNSGGGGFFVGRNSSTTVTNSTISGNSADSGGGFSIYPGGFRTAGGTVTVTNSTISNNRSSNKGAAFSLGLRNAATLTNVTATGNSSYSRGGVMYLDGTNRVSIVNSTLTCPLKRPCP